MAENGKCSNNFFRSGFFNECSDSDSAHGSLAALVVSKINGKMVRRQWKTHQKTYVSAAMGCKRVDAVNDCVSWHSGSFRLCSDRTNQVIVVGWWWSNPREHSDYRSADWWTIQLLEWHFSTIQSKRNSSHGIGESAMTKTKTSLWNRMTWGMCSKAKRK